MQSLLGWSKPLGRHPLNIRRGQDRVALHLQSQQPEIREYIAELEREVDRLQRRSKAHRQNIRSMSAKLELANLKTEVDCYTKMSRNPKGTNIDTLNQAIRAVG